MPQDLGEVQSEPASSSAPGSPASMSGTGCALVTGASSGIGAATALALASRKVPVIGVARNPTRLLDEHPSARGLRFLDLVSGDMTRSDEVEAVFAQAESTRGPIHYVVHSVGLDFEPNWYQRISSDEILRSLSALIYSPALVLRQALRSMEGTGGKVGMISSGAANRPTPGRALYSTAKIALNRLVESVAAECEAAHPEIGVFAVLPGRVDTPMQGRLMTVAPDLPDAFQLGRFQSREGLLDPNTVGTAVADLLAVDAEGLNGRIFRYRAEGWLATNR